MTDIIQLFKSMKHSRKGVTLVELVVCMTLTSIFAVVCIGLINPIERIYNHSQETGRAQLIADTVLDSLRQECANTMSSDESAVWIANSGDFASMTDDSALFDPDLRHDRTEGDVLVFRRSNTHCEAIYSCVPVSQTNRDNAVTNAEGQSRSVVSLFESEDSIKQGIVHFGYYTLTESADGYPIPAESYDYTNPVPSATYGDYSVAVKFKNIGYAVSDTDRVPAYVECEVYVYKGDYDHSFLDYIYKRSSVLCFTVNGSGQGFDISGAGNGSNGGGEILPPEEVGPDGVMIKVVFAKGKDENNPPPIPSFDDAHPFLAALYLNGVRGQVVPIIPNAATREGIYTFDDVDPSAIDSSNPVWVVDHYDGYSLESIRIDGTTVVVTYVPVEGKLLLGNDFNNKIKNKNDITNIIFGKTDDYIGGLSGVTSVVVSTKDSGEVYNMYIKDGTAYILSESGHFNANTSCQNMFSNLSNLQTIEGLEKINFCNTTSMQQMFLNCKNLEDADFGESSFPRVETMFQMFRECNKLKKFDMLHRITASTRNLSEAFYRCYALEYVDFTGADLSGVENMKDMCKECTSILELNLTVCSKTPTNPINMQSVVRMCSSLTTFRAHDMTWSSMRQSFEGCSSLTTLDLENIDISQIDYLISTFNGCSSLEKIDFNVFVRDENGILDLSHVLDAEKMFCDCTSLTVISGFNNVDFSSLIKVDKMFANSPVDNLDISGMKLPLITSLNPMFYDITLKHLNISGATLTGINTFDSLFKNKTTLVSVNFSDVIAKNSSMSTQYMFSGCTSLERVEISSTSGFKTSNANQMFSGCGELEYLDIDGLIGDDCTSMYRMFYHCAKLFRVSFGTCDVSNVTSMKEMCCGCTALTSLDMSGCTSKNMSKEIDMTAIVKDCTKLKTFKANDIAVSNLYQAFYNCPELVNMRLSGIDASKCTNMAYLFYNCSSLEKFDFEIAFTKTDGKVDLKKVTSIAYMFQNCTSLSNIGMKNVYFEELLYFRDIFYGCHGFTTLDLTGIHMPAACKEIKQFLTNDSVNTLILDNAVLELDSLKEQFKGNNQLVTFRMNNATLANCTSVQGLFQNCSNLNTVEITNTDLDACETCESMFQNCKKLETVVMSSFKTPACTNMNNMFRECNSVRGDIVLSGWDTRRVATMEYMFYDFGTNMSNNRTTTENVTLDISSFSFEKVTSCKEMFCVNGKSENGLSFINDYLTLVILPESANAVNLTTMYRMFSFRINLKEIRNMGGFITSNNLINTTSTFANCRSVTTIDISSMNLSGVKESRWMFNTNANTVNVLTTIYVSDDPAHAFNPSILSSGNSSNMFENSMSLVGGNGTVYDPSKLDRTYARIDGLNDLHGYFSVKPAA